MNHFQAEKISKSYGDKVLFENISFSISQGDKIGLIARNGTGKTSLLNIIAGYDKADQGTCSYRSGLRLAYLEQEPRFDPGLNISEALLYADNELTRTVRQYEEFMQASARGGPQEDKNLQSIIERMDALGAWDYEQKIKQILTRLQIGDLNARVGNLSGGQQKRLALARILIEEADFILLDEPTNHLDIDMIEWLEGYLGRQKLTLLVVTHDRYFLDSTCQGILELDQGQMHVYRGNYAYFLEKKQERMAAQTTRSEKALNLLRKEQEWMRRSPPARTTKSKARIESFHDLKGKALLPSDDSPGEINVGMARMGKKILEIKDIEKRFGDLLVLKDFSHVFKKGERLGIVGPNGSGKTTLVNIITGALLPDKGSVITGETIRFGYYRQEGLQVDEGKKVIDVIKDIAEQIELGDGKSLTASQLLQYFNFPFQVQHDMVSKLSGGEKRRLYLVTVLMNQPNFLILDEPTNDLDIETLNVLEDFLAGFRGCLVIVSHDRYLLDRLADQLFVCGDNGSVRGYTGNYSAFKLKKQSEDTGRQNKAAPPPRSSPPRDKNKLSYKEQQELKVLEETIDNLEKEKSLLLEKMNGGTLDPEALFEASKRYETLSADIEQKGDRWLKLSERI